MNRHEVDVLSLVFGVAFLVVAAVWAVAMVIDISWFSIGWLFAGGLVLMGMAGIFSAIRPGHRRQQTYRSACGGSKGPSQPAHR